MHNQTSKRNFHLSIEQQIKKTVQHVVHVVLQVVRVKHFKHKKIIFVSRRTFK
jgi:hypothetical protein